MTKKNKTIDEYDKYMYKDVDTDIDSQQRTRRERQLQDWDKQQAQKIAREEGVELTDSHLQVIQLLRTHYIEHGQVQSGRELDDMLLSDTLPDGLHRPTGRPSAGEPKMRAQTPGRPDAFPWSLQCEQPLSARG